MNYTYNRKRSFGNLTFFLFIFVFFIVTNSDAFLQQDVRKDSLRLLLNQWKIKLSSEPQNGMIMAKVASIYFKLGADDSTDFWLNLSEKIDKSNPEIYFWKGRLFLKKGKISIIPVEKLMALLKQDNNSKAINNFKKAIQYRADFLEAYYYLGIAHVEKGGNSHFQDAITAYLYLLEQNDDFKDTGYQLGIAYHKIKQYENAFKAYNTYYNQHPEDSRPFIELSRLFLETGDTEKASRYFMEGIVKLTNVELLEKLFLEIQDIATSGEKDHYESLSVNQKGYFFKKFWKSRDPTPLTDENERFSEHFRRVQFAKETYSSMIPPYYDDRGRVYVKYGKPDDRYVSSAMEGGGVKDNESWSYQRTVREGLVFDFVQVGNIYNLVQDLTAAAPTGSDYGTRLALAGELYNNRSGDLGGVYNRFAIDFKQTDLYDFVNEKTAAVQSAPEEVYQFDYKAEPLPFVVRIAQFRGSNEQTWLDIYRGVATKNLHFDSGNNNLFNSKLKTSIVIFDSLFNEVKKIVFPSDLSFETQEQIQRAISIDQTSAELQPNRYQVAVQIENSAGNKLGIQKFNLSVRPFHTDSLQLSDLELASKIEPASEPDQFYKDGLKVVPYLFNTHTINKPLHLYYEIYNLKPDIEGNTKYQIDYKITLIQRKEGGVKKFFRSIGSIFGKGKQSTVTTSYSREGKRSNEKEYISLDIQKMNSGLNELSVIVTDMVANTTTSSTIKLEFIKSDGE